MRRSLLLLSASGGLAVLAAGLVAAQEPPPPRAEPAPAAPTAPAAAAPGAPLADGSAGAAPPVPGAPIPGAAPAPPTALPNAAAPAPAPEAPEAEAPEAPTQAAAAPPPEPLKRPRFEAAIIQGIDKITAETIRFEARVGQPVRWKGLILTVHACETTAPDEASFDALAHLDVQSQPELAPGRAASAPRLVFRGWMSADSPSLHPMEHPVYDVWLIACRSASPSA